MNYVPLYIKTHNSLLSSMIKIDELIKYALDNNINTLTITDNNMYGVMDFYKKCKQNYIKPIVGLEIKIDDKIIILYVKNYLGYKNLLKISTIMTEKVIEISDIEAYCNNIIAIIPYDSYTIYDKIKSIFEDVFISYKNLDERNKLVNYQNLIFMNETLYLKKQDSSYINYLYAIKNGTLIYNTNVNKNDNYLYTYDEIKSLYPDDLENNFKISELCNLEIKMHSNLLPIYKCPNNIDSFTYLKKLCIEGLKRIFGTKVNKIYIDRLKYELDVINKMGFCNYFLVVWDYVLYAKNNSILVGAGRGSAAGSLVSYCLNITTIDPIKYNLLFERFLNPERITMPDIDIDFEYNRREEVINYCINKYGIKKVAPIITFGTLASKQAIRDVGRVMDIDLNVIDYICKNLDSRLSLKDNYQRNEKLREYLNPDKELMKLYKVSSKFEGIKRHTSIHAAGIVMCENDLDEYIPLDKSHSEFYTTAYSMEYLEELGLLKMDFLALRNLTLISDTIEHINKDLNINLTFDNIPENDSKAISIFTNVYTLGIFQFESDGMMNFLRKLKPTTFEDIFSAIALFRPGPMDNIDSYINRKKGLEKIDYIHPSLVDILKNTYGIIIYQEQIMQIASTMAGYSYGEADILRRAMSKKKESVMLSERDKFISSSIKNGYDENIANKVYDLILKFASYGFNRAHSVAYSMIAYKMAYLKARYPLYFMQELLTMVIGSEIKTKQYIYECNLNNIKILKPDINLSDKKYIVEENGIRYPLNNIKNVGIMAVEEIINKRNNKPFVDIFDFVKRTYGKSINRKTLVSLIFSGCLDSFNINKKTLIENLDAIINYGEIGELLDSEALKPILTNYEEYDKKYLMMQELECFGFYLSNNPITEYKNRLKGVINLSQIEYYFDKKVKVVVTLDKIKNLETKKHDKMCFIKVSDEVSTIDLVLFPKVYNNYLDIKNGDIYVVKGRVEKRFDAYQVVVNEMQKLD